MPALILTLAAAMHLFAALLILGARRPAYSQRRHTISELGESGAPQARLVAAGVFLPIGLAMLLAAWLAHPLGSGTSALALCIAVGYLAAAAFPCDPGSPCPAAGARPFITSAARSSTAAAHRSCGRWPDTMGKRSGRSHCA